MSGKRYDDLHIGGHDGGWIEGGGFKVVGVEISLSDVDLEDLGRKLRERILRETDHNKEVTKITIGLITRTLKSIYGNEFSFIQEFNELQLLGFAALVMAERLPQIIESAQSINNSNHVTNQRLMVFNCFAAIIIAYLFAGQRDSMLGYAVAALITGIAENWHWKKYNYAISTLFLLGLCFCLYVVITIIASFL